MVKVLIITSMGSPPYIGGIENVVDTILNSNLANKYSMTLFDTFRKPDPERKITQKIFYAISLFFMCGQHIVKEKPQIVHIHFCSRVDFWKHSICLLAAKLLGRKTVFHLHGGSFDSVYKRYNWIKQYLVRLIFKLADTSIALSNYWQLFLSDITSPKKIQILPNPINCQELASSSKKYFDVNRRSILLLGCLGERKGHYDVLKALPTVLERYPGTQVYFGGLDEDVGATDKLIKIATDTNIIDNVRFIGAITGAPKLKLIGSSTVVILPSYGENMPISVLEGMAAGKPVISTYVGAIPEALEDGECGMLIKPGDWRALSDNIIYLFDNTKYAENIGRSAHRKALVNWDIGKISSMTDGIYKNLMQDQRSIAR